ncbi:CaiB/BaiF CoA transferase family protein [Chloroflexota bacterium]
MDEPGKVETMLGPYRVLDLTDEKGIFCGALLGSLGADVIKVEPPGGDPVRNIGPFYHDDPDPEKSLFWLAYNVNKRGITLDIETIRGKELLKRLVETADVVVESFKPGYMYELGLGYSELEKINPRTIMVSISPFGQTGPYRDYKGSDLVCWALGGLLGMSGDPDRPPVSISHIPSSFLLAGYDGAWSAAMALYWRRSSGQGQHLDISIQESMDMMTFYSHEKWWVSGEEYDRMASGFKVPVSGVLLRRLWEASDGYIAFFLFPGEQGRYRNPLMVKWLDDEGMADDFLRGIDWLKQDWGYWSQASQEDADRQEAYFARFFKSKTTAQLLAEAIARRIQLHPMSTPKSVLSHPQLEARGFWQEVEHPQLGATLSYPSRVFTASEAPCKLWRRAPLIGEHNGELYREMGLSGGEIITLQKDGVI